MKQRGRKSAASMSVVPAVPGQRPEPPEGLTAEQAEVWRSVVQTKPPEWFTDDSHPLLVAYCQHVVTARGLGVAVDKFDTARLSDPEQARHYDKLLAMRERETRAITALARAMRLTQQARYDAKRASTSASKAQRNKPWEA